MEGREYRKRKKAWEPEQACIETVESESRKNLLGTEIRTPKYFEQITRGTELDKSKEDPWQN